MYCPQCATHLAATATRCHECNLDVQQIGRMLREPSTSLAGQMQRWKAQRRSLGTLLVMCSLLVGCLIPISIGLFREFEALSSIVVGLAGLAGLVLVIGSMLLMAADGAILTGDDQSHGAAESASAQREHKSYAASR
ncbi:MAG TPA: hypothetical protein VGD58_17975 [Herpetosiphonaceae bacterium]